MEHFTPVSAAIGGSLIGFPQSCRGFCAIGYTGFRDDGLTPSASRIA